MTPPIEQEPTAKEVARMLTILDSPRTWTARPFNPEQWQHANPLVSSDGLEINFYEDPHNTKRWKIDADLPSELTKQLNRHQNEVEPRITVSKDRDPLSIAKDVNRRVLGEMRRLRALALHRRRDETDKAEAAHQTALEFVAAGAGYIEILDNKDPYNPSSDGFKLYMNRQNGTYLRANVSKYSGSLHIEMIDLPNDLALQVFATIAAYLKQREAQP